MKESLQPSDLWAETINGITTLLGRMTCDQLVALEASCRERMVEAQVDMEIVADYRARLYPDHGAVS